MLMLMLIVIALVIVIVRRGLDRNPYCDAANSSSNIEGVVCSQVFNNGQAYLKSLALQRNVVLLDAASQPAPPFHVSMPTALQASECRSKGR